MEARDLIADLVRAGWTQTRIADRTGIPQPTISKVARGDVDDVLSRNYRKLLELHAEAIPAPAPPDAAAAPAPGATPKRRAEDVRA